MSFRPDGHWHDAMVAPDRQSFCNRIDDLPIDPIDGYAALDGLIHAADAENGGRRPRVPRPPPQIRGLAALARVGFGSLGGGTGGGGTASGAAAACPAGASTICTKISPSFSIPSS